VPDSNADERDLQTPRVTFIAVRVGTDERDNRSSQTSAIVTLNAARVVTTTSTIVGVSNAEARPSTPGAWSPTSTPTGARSNADECDLHAARVVTDERDPRCPFHTPTSVTFHAARVVTDEHDDMCPFQTPTSVTFHPRAWSPTSMTQVPISNADECDLRSLLGCRCAWRQVPDSKTNEHDLRPRLWRSTSVAAGVVSNADEHDNRCSFQTPTSVTFNAGRVVTGGINDCCRFTRRSMTF
jgi:hypothetical protein